MRTSPPHVTVYRSVITALTLLILAGAVLGFAGYGPLTALHQAASPVYRALHLDKISG
jgi:hypothetical protein